MVRSLHKGGNMSNNAHTMINIEKQLPEASPRPCPVSREVTMPAAKIAGITGVILAGGASSRMGSNKALLLHHGGRMIEGVYRTLSTLFAEVIIVTNSPELYQFIPCRKVADIYPGKGVMSGIHAGLSQSSEAAVFVVACDMPHLQSDLIRHLATAAWGADLVLPFTPGGFEPLHAIYRKECLPALEELLREERQQRVAALFSRVKVHNVPSEEIAAFDPDFRSFDNINTPQDYFRLRTCENNS